MVGDLPIMDMAGEDLITAMVVDTGDTTPTTILGDTHIMDMDTTTTIMEDLVAVQPTLRYVPTIVTVSIPEQEVRVAEM